jgi:predicted DNA-binding WGR domain protein
LAAPVTVRGAIFWGGADGPKGDSLDRPPSGEESAVLRLERRDPARNMLRFYTLQVSPNLFGEWCLLRAWGRIGRPGHMRAECFVTRQQAADALWMLERAKRRRGYL